ncbi:hypothetical protein D3C87_1665700 [compost metagenome]
MKTLFIILAISLSGFFANATPPDHFKPLFPINTQPEKVASTTAEEEASDPEAQRHYSNICCIGYGYYCYMYYRYPVGTSCYCYDRGYYYYGWVCRY